MPGKAERANSEREAKRQDRCERRGGVRKGVSARWAVSSQGPVSTPAALSHVSVPHPHRGTSTHGQRPPGVKAASCSRGFLALTWVPQHLLCSREAGSLQNAPPTIHSGASPIIPLSDKAQGRLPDDLYRNEGKPVLPSHADGGFELRGPLVPWPGLGG